MSPTKSPRSDARSFSCASCYHKVSLNATIARSFTYLLSITCLPNKSVSYLSLFSIFVMITARAKVSNCGRPARPTIWCTEIGLYSTKPWPLIHCSVDLITTKCAGKLTPCALCASISNTFPQLLRWTYKDEVENNTCTSSLRKSSSTSFLLAMSMPALWYARPFVMQSEGCYKTYAEEISTYQPRSYR
jgi:hypothetical protein